MDIWEIYDRIALLITALDQADLRDHADNLQDAVLSGPTSGEIPDNLRDELHRLEKLELGADITDTAKGLLRDMNEFSKDEAAIPRSLKRL